MPSCGHHDGAARLPQSLHGRAYLLPGFRFGSLLRYSHLPTGILLAVTRYIRVRCFVGRRDPHGSPSPGREAEGRAWLTGVIKRGDP